MTKLQVCPRCAKETPIIAEKCSMCDYKFIVGDINFDNTIYNENSNKFSYTN